MGKQIKEQIEEQIGKSGQIICCGAPGTGKSYKTETDLQNVPEGNIFRTASRPDSGCSTFAGQPPRVNMTQKNSILTDNFLQE